MEASLVLSKESKNYCIRLKIVHLKTEGTKKKGAVILLHNTSSGLKNGITKVEYGIFFISLFT